MSNRKNNSQLLQHGQLLSTARCCARKRWPAAALGHWQHHDLSAPCDYQQGLQFRATTRAEEVSRETSVPSPHPESPGAPVSAPLAGVRLPAPPPRTLRTHLATWSHTPPPLFSSSSAEFSTAMTLAVRSSSLQRTQPQPFALVLPQPLSFSLSTHLRCE